MSRTADHAVIVTASLVGLWAGFSAPAVSPVLPEAAVARSVGVDLPALLRAEGTAIGAADPGEATTGQPPGGRDRWGYR